MPTKEFLTEGPKSADVSRILAQLSTRNISPYHIHVLTQILKHYLGLGRHRDSNTGDNKIQDKETTLNQELIKYIRDDYASEISGLHKNTIPLRLEFIYPEFKIKPEQLKQLSNYLDNLVLHQGLETNTPATDEIESIIRKTLTGFGKKELADRFRVCISKRTKELNASCLPDATIIISQELINQLGSLDLVMGVIFHEVSHYEEKHFSKKPNFIKEVSADTTLTSKYLDESGLNSMGLLRALGKIEDIENRTGRSLNYLSFMKRRDTIRAQHKVYHFKHSHLLETELPDFIKHESVPSNRESLSEIVKKPFTNIKEINFVFQNLSKNDLYQIYFDQDFSSIYTFDCLKILRDLFIQRLRSNGFKDELELEYAMACLTKLIAYQYPYPEDFPQSLENIIKVIPYSKNLNKINNILFGELEESQIQLTSHNFLENIIKLYEVNCNLQGRFNLDKFPKMSHKEFVYFLGEYFEDCEKDTRYKEDLVLVYETLIKTFIQVDLSQQEIDEIVLYIKNSKISFIFQDIAKTFKDGNRYYGNVNESNTMVANYQILKDFTDSYYYVPEDRRQNILSSFEKVFGYIDPEKNFDSLKYIEDFFANFVKKDENLDYYFDDFGIEFTKLIEGMKHHLDKIVFKNFEFQDNEENEELVIQIIYKIFAELDKLPFEDPDFAGKNKESLMFYGIPIFNSSKLNPEFNIEYMERFKKYVLFFSKVTALLVFYTKDKPSFYKSLTDLMNNSGIDFNSHDIYEQLRIIYPLLNIDSYRRVTKKLPLTGSTFFDFREYITRNGANGVDTVSITHIDQLEQLPFVNQFLNNQISLIESIDSVDGLIKFLSEVREKFNISSDSEIFYDFVEKDILNDNLIYSKVFSDFRKKFIELLTSVELDSSNYQGFYKLTELIFPESPQKNSILSGLRMIFLENESLTFVDRLDFFKKYYMDFSYEEILKLVESIKSDNEIPGSYWKNWNLFLNEFSKIKDNFLEDASKLRKLNMYDFILETLTPYETLISASANPLDAQKATNDLLKFWFLTASSIDFDRDSLKFKLDNRNRHVFQSFRDMIESLQGLSFIQRFNIVKNCLNGERGLLRSEDGKNKLGIILCNILNFDNNFIDELILSACESSDYKSRDFLINTIAFFIAKDLFKNLDLNLIDLQQIRNKFGQDKNNLVSQIYDINKKNDSIRFFPNINSELFALDDVSLLSILRSITEDIKLFSPQYSSVSSTLISPMIQDTERDFQKIRELLLKLTNSKSSITTFSQDRDSNEELPQNIDLLVQGLEQTILGTRSIQMTNQLYSFSNPAIRKRFSESFDAAPGMNRFQFLLNLTSTAERDPNVEFFLKNSLIDIVRASNKRDSLGGASMATVFKAKIIDSNTNEIVESAIRCLIPNALQEIDEMYFVISQALSLTETKPRRKNETRSELRNRVKQARITQLITQLAKEWCMDDINDPHYEENDDRFRETVLEKFLIANPEYNFVAPERIYTSKIQDRHGIQSNWVRVEGYAPGVSLRKFLDDPVIDREFKIEVIMQIYKFILFQYSQSPKTGEKALIQSDPSIGNFNIEILPDGKSKIHILDRGFMLEMDKSRAELFRLFFDDPNDSKIEGLKKKFKFLKKLVIEVRKHNSQEVNELKVNFQIIKKLYELLSKSRLFVNTISMSDVILAINEAFTELNLKVPVDIQLPIKNISGWKSLLKEYSN